MEYFNRVTTSVPVPVIALLPKYILSEYKQHLSSLLAGFEHCTSLPIMLTPQTITRVVF